MPAVTLTLRLTRDELVASVLDAAGIAFADASCPVETLSPEPGWMEQRPDDWWASTIAAITALRDKSSLAAVRWITVVGDFSASVLLDGERESIRPAILDGDSRGRYPILWLRRHQPIAYKRAQHLLQPADYVRLMLTGEIATAAADAMRTGLFDAVAGAWDKGQCEELEINVAMLPPVAGEPLALLAEVADRFGLQSAFVT